MQASSQCPQQVNKDMNIKMKSDLCYNSWYLHTVHASAWLVWLFSIMQELQGGNSPGWNCFRGDGVQMCPTEDCKYAKIQMCFLQSGCQLTCMSTSKANTKMRTEKFQHSKHSGTKPTFCKSFFNLCVPLVRTPEALSTVKLDHPKFPFSIRIL